MKLVDFPNSSLSENCKFLIRPIQLEDNDKLFTIIHTVMPEFGAVGAGFAIEDAEVTAMYEAYTKPGTAYFIVEREEEVQGGAGIAPLSGAEPVFCELRKMYFLKNLRGLGAGQALITLCLETARAIGYRFCYLETLTHMYAARKLYAKNGFKQLPNPLGNTGHFGCNSFYLLEL